MRPVALVIALGLGACGRSETYTGVADVAAALDSGEPRCDRDGGTPLLDQLTNPGNPPASWGRLDACIDVTYEIDAAPVLNDLRVALSSWTAPSCTWMCFTAPEPRGDRPAAPSDRRIHLGLIQKSDNLPGNERATTQVQYVDSEIVNATILIRDEDDAPGKAPLLLLLGQVLGFLPTPGVDSVLNDRTDVVFSLTQADEQSVCAAYPTCR